MKKIISLVLCLVAILMLTSCGNRTIFDTTYTFDEAIIKLQDGTVIKGKVQSWRDFSDGDQLQIRIDGKTYLVHSINVTLISN